MRKRVLCHMRTTKAQISLRIRAVWSAPVVRYLDSVMSLVSVTKISSLMLASVAEQASLSLTWSETPEDTFSHDEAYLVKNLPSLLRTASCFDAFLQISDKWSLKFRLNSMLTPNRVTLSSHLIRVEPIWNFSIASWVFYQCKLPIIYLDWLSWSLRQSIELINCFLLLKFLLKYGVCFSLVVR